MKNRTQDFESADQPQVATETAALAGSAFCLFWTDAVLILVQVPYFFFFIYSMASAGTRLLFLVWWWTRRGISLGSHAGFPVSSQRGLVPFATICQCLWPAFYRLPAC